MKDSNSTDLKVREFHVVSASNQFETTDLAILTWIKVGVRLICDVLDIFSQFSLRTKNLASNCLFLCKIFFFPDILLDISGHVTDHALNWKKYGQLSYEM